MSSELNQNIKKNSINIVQKKDKSELVIDEYNIYENKVAVRLVDHLRTYLFNRIIEVKNLHEMIYETNYRLDSYSWINHSLRRII